MKEQVELAPPKKIDWNILSATPCGEELSPRENQVENSF